MMLRFRRAAVLPLAFAAALAVASPAMARGGAGGGGGGGGGGGAVVVDPNPCAPITGWTSAPYTFNTQQYVVLSVTVMNTCLDHGAGGVFSPPTVKFTETDTATGVLQGASFFSPSFGVSTTYTWNVPVLATPALTLTVTVTRVNGLLEATRSATYAEIIASALPAAG